MVESKKHVKIKDISEFGNYSRLSMNEYFSMIAIMVSQRSTCLRKHVGAVIVNNNEIISTGYNGSPRGTEHCLTNGCYMRDGHCIRAIHSEQNALLQMGRPDNYDNLEIYVTDYPCQICAKLIVNANIKKIHFVRNYNNSDKFTEELFKHSNIKLIKENIIDKGYVEEV